MVVFKEEERETAAAGDSYKVAVCCVDVIV